MYLSIASYFYPRPPRGGRPLDSWHYGDNYTISIHALREEGDIDVHVTVIHDRISIHALREEGDFRHVGCQAFKADFYPRPPRGGRPQEAFKSMQFNSDFYPRPPRGGRLRLPQ